MNTYLRKIIYLGLLVAFGLVLHLFEQVIPTPFPLPGAKLGLANIITVVTLALYGFRSALFVAVMRVFLGSLLAGTFMGFPFFLSFSGALVSLCLMALCIPLYRRETLSLIGISLVGASSHNVTQLLMASFLMEQLGIVFLYLPYLLAFALPTGFFTGLVSTLMVSVIEKNFEHIKVTH